MLLMGTLRTICVTHTISQASRALHAPTLRASKDCDITKSSNGYVRTYTTTHSTPRIIGYKAAIQHMWDVDIPRNEELQPSFLALL